MKYVVVVLSVLLFPLQAAAQSDVGVQATGLLSIQPVDESWVGMPYLDKGLGGVGPGLGAAVHVVTHNRFTLGAEFSLGFFSEEQEGRLISGSIVGVKATNTLHDALLAGVAGYSQRDGDTEVRYLAGGGVLVSDTDKADMLFVPTGGIDVLQHMSRRVAIVITGRYAYVNRTPNGSALAAGPHIIRVGAGIRIGLN